MVSGLAFSHGGDVGNFGFLISDLGFEKSGIRKAEIRLLVPGFNAERWNTGEFTPVVGHEGQSQANGLAGDEEVVGADFTA